MRGRDGTEKYLRWRVEVGDPVGRRHRRWPISTWGSGRTRLPAEQPDPGDPARPWPTVFVGRMTVAARSVRWLRHLLDHPVSLARVRRVTVVVDDWRIPQRGWSGRLGPVPHLLTERIRMPRTDRGRAMVEIEVRWSVPLRSVLVAVLPLFTPVRPLPSPGSPELMAQDLFPDWLGAGPNIGVQAGELVHGGDVRPYDVVLRPDDGRPAGPDDGAGTTYRRMLIADGLGAGPATAGATDALPAPGTGPARVTVGGPVLVDLEYAVPADRYGPFGPDAPRAELVLPAQPGEARWRIVGPDGLVLHGRLDRSWLTEEQHSALAGIGLLHCRSVPGADPRAEAALLLQLALAGVLVHAPNLPAPCRGHLADEVAELISAPLPDAPGGPADQDAGLAWEIRAVRQRRAAMRGHGRGFVLPRLVAAGGPVLDAPPSVTALLVTRRLGYVLDAVAAIEAQSYPELEIVLCLHGVELPAELRARLTARGARPLGIVEVPAGHSFGEAVAVATSRARGSLVTKFDDDDTYGPEHVWDLVLARHHSGATLVGKAAEFVHLRTLDITVRRDAGAAESFAPVVAGGTMLIGRGDLEQVGGWRPVPRSVDRGLLDRVRRAGGLVYRTHPLGYVYQRRSTGHTWDPGLEYFLRDSGPQWSGLPRHGEFGTAPAPTARPAPTGSTAGPGAAAGAGPAGSGRGVPVTGPPRSPGVGYPAPDGAADAARLRQDGDRVAGHCRRP